MILDFYKDFTNKELEYINSLSTSELKEIKNKCLSSISSSNTAQINRKLLANSAYGALGNVYFRYYSLPNATAITIFGQFAIQWTARKIDEYLNTLIKSDEHYNYSFYIDTDSVVGSTIIDVNGSKISIEDYYNSISDENLVRDTPKDFVKKIEFDTSIGMDNTKKIVRKPIKYIMKHKVKKRLFKITVKGKSVTVTEDHSVIVSRDGKLISVKPMDIKKTDKLIKNENTHNYFIETNDFIIEDLGIQEEWVYDIEVEDVHNFFANDILVHNSIYVNLDNLVELASRKVNFDTNEKLIDFLDKFSEEKLQYAINSAMEELFEYMNNYENLMHMDREVISIPSVDSKGLGGFWTSKKRYALNVYDSEGTRFAEPHLKIMGLETQRSSTPSALRGTLYECIKLLCQEGEEALQKKVESFRDEYDRIHYTERATVSSANNISKYNENGYPGKGTPFHIKGVLLYNRLLSEYEIEGTQPIDEGSKVMVLPLKKENPWREEWISWPSGLELPYQIEELLMLYIDFNLQFDKTFIKPLDAICKSCGINYEKTNTLLDFFDI